MSLGNLCKIPTTIVSSVKLFYINCKCDTVVFLTRKYWNIYIFFWTVRKPCLGNFNNFYKVIHMVWSKKYTVGI